MVVALVFPITCASLPSTFFEHFLIKGKCEKIARIILEKYLKMYEKIVNMFIIFNWIGLIILIVSIIIYPIFKEFIPWSSATFYLYLGSVFIVLDLGARFFVIKKYFPKSKEKGGSLFFIPVYILGIICVLVSIYYFFQ